MTTILPKQKGFTIVELLIVIVVIGILAAITIVAYNGIQARANDAKIKSAANQIEKAIQLFYLDTGKPPYSGSDSTGAVSNNTCPGSTVASGWASKGFYYCTIEDLLVSSNQLPSTFFSSLPPNKAYGNTAFTFMFYQCGAIASNSYALYWYLTNPSSEESTNLNTVLTQCGQSANGLSTSYGMRAAKIIQL